jgi:hypothetical protein
MADDEHRGVSGGTLSNKAHAGALGRGAPVSSMLQSPSRSMPLAESSIGAPGNMATDESLRMRCAGCNASLMRQSKVSLTGPEKTSSLSFIRGNRQSLLARQGGSSLSLDSRSVEENDFICLSCFRMSQHRAQTASESGDSSIELTILRSSSTHAMCVFGCRSEHLYSVPQAVSDNLSIIHRYYIPPDARCCKMHLEGDQWHSLPSTGECQFLVLSKLRWLQPRG